MHTLWSTRSLALSTQARPEVAIFGASRWILRQHHDLSQILMALKEKGALEWRKREPHFIHRHILPLLQSGCKSLIYLLVTLRPDYFEMSVADLMFLETSIRGILFRMRLFQRTLRGALDDLFRIRVFFVFVQRANKELQNPIPYVRNSRGMKIEVCNVSFAYRKESAPVLKNVSFTIEPGQIVSIVGYNGAGCTICM